MGGSAFLPSALYYGKTNHVGFSSVCGCLPFLSIQQLSSPQTSLPEEEKPQQSLQLG